MKKEKQNNRQVGEYYEKIAGSYLEEKGYLVLAYNYRCRSGEIDIIAKEQNTIVFIEVKYRSSNSKGHPLDAVTPAKQRVISKCALFYLTEHGLLCESCRFDVMGITDEEICLIRNAFEYIT